MVWTGLISYPLYLWHWPLLSFASIIWGVKVPYLAKISLLFAATLLSIATYRYVERPIRRTKNVRGTVGLLVAGMGIVGAAGVMIAVGAISQRINPGQADIYLDSNAVLQKALGILAEQRRRGHDVPQGRCSLKAI